jgi:AcrR family transcriptional regulator
MAVRATPPLKPRKSPRQARSEATVEAIFDATIQVLLSSGARRMTTTSVAERAGVSVGTMYQYFPNKQALLYAVIDRYLKEVAVSVEEACERCHGQPTKIASQALVDAYLDAKLDQGDRARALYLASAEIEVLDLVENAFQRFQRATAKLFSSSPDASPETIDDATFAILTTLTGATRVLIEQNADERQALEFRRLMSLMCSTFLDAFASR